MASKMTLVCCLIVSLFGHQTLAEQTPPNNTDYQRKVDKVFLDGFTYNGHTYFLSRDFWESSAVAQATCYHFDGYLVEINDEEERAAVANFIAELEDPVSNIAIDGTDRDEENTWTLYSGEPIPVLEWNVGRPKNKGDCLAMTSNTGRMDDVPCYRSDPDKWAFRFLCEIPHLTAYTNGFPRSKGRNCAEAP